jgi:hypothetical protein
MYLFYHPNVLINFETVSPICLVFLLLRTYFMSVLVSFDEVTIFLHLAGFVKNLIRKKQFVGAVRFSYAYNVADNNQLVDLLREFIQNAKLICESSCNKTNSIEIKVLLFFLLKFYLIKHYTHFHTYPCMTVINKLLLCT